VGAKDARPKAALFQPLHTLERENVCVQIWPERGTRGSPGSRRKRAKRLHSWETPGRAPHAPPYILGGEWKLRIRNVYTGNAAAKATGDRRQPRAMGRWEGATAGTVAQ